MSRAESWARRCLSAAALAVSRLLLRLYHPSFRTRYGDEMLDLYTKLEPPQSLLAQAGRIARISTDALRHGIATRYEYRHRRLPLAPPVRGGSDMHTTTMDFRQALRGLLKQRSQSVLLIGTLALATGSATAIFSVVDQVVLRPLAFGEPERLVRFWGSERGELDANGTIAYLDLLDWHQRSNAFEAVAAYDEWTPNLSGDGEPLRINAATVSANFFDLLSVTPHRGRFFLPEEDEDGKDAVVVLSHQLWKSRYGGSPEIVGRPILLNDRDHIVVGVAPPLEGTGLATDRREAAQLWRPNGFLGVAADRLPNRGSESWAGIGRLKSAWSLDQAQVEIDHVAAALEKEYPDSNRGRGVVLRPLQEQIVGDARGSLFLLAGAVGLLFLVALVNVAGVLLGRAAERLHDTALRAALGARRFDLFRRDLVEGLLFGAMGGLCGLPLAWVMIQLLLAWIGDALPRPVVGVIDGRIAAFAIVASLLAGALCSLPPGLSVVWRSLLPTLRSGASSLTGSRSSVRTRNVLVAAEIGLSLVLLFGAAVLGLGLWNLRAVDTGVESANLLTFQLNPSRSSYPDTGALDGLYSQLLERLAAVPAVESAALTNIVPLSGDFDGNGVWADDWPEKTMDNELSAQTRTISPDYFETMGIELVRGDAFGLYEGGAERVAIVNRRLASRLWPDTDPIGRFVRSSADESRPIRVVGMVEDVKHLSLEEEAPARIYFLRSQGLVAWQLRRVTVVVRASADPLAEELGLIPVIRETVRALDPNLPVSNLSTMSQLIDRTMASPRLRASLTLAFGIVALILTGVGIYAAISHSVALRHREVAIRVALGAGRTQVAIEMMRQTMKLVVVGLLFGALLVMFTGPLLERFVFQLDWSQALAFGSIPVILMIAAAALATLGPVARANRVEPTVVLRNG